ncbi:transcription repressor NadR [Marinococcus sp. PL1-022]|jgi:transcriptional regulator of NAD metabolism|uniref:transcription repressor NadR n=1 Tax=Marinococcus sp. PL1-022 TaxID=3095363 RepID=UPI0026350DD4|nr:transcription repressor NadR [Marinococcus sp. PL1-022]MDX6153406.1 transcription repressor NadR [Marinococcus sp. PL1-022]
MPKDSSKKMLGADRRSQLLEWLEMSVRPLTGSSLASRASVSRQVIVQDMSLLKAQGHPILATSQGYIIIQNKNTDQTVQKRVAVSHPSDPASTLKELYLIVDHGGKIVDVSVEHPVYGDITASLMIESRIDADRFIKNMKNTNASMLSELTAGVHLHTIEIPSHAQFDVLLEALQSHSYLISEDN